MGETRIRTTQVQGFEAQVLDTGLVELALIPSLGARLVSLRHKHSGREWLWHRPVENWLWASSYGSNFGDSPQAGIDECLPSVSGCRVGGREIPDHGDLWAVAWECDQAALSQGILRHRAAARSMPLILTRSLRALAPNRIEFAYELENLGDEALPYLWCHHPLFTLSAGDRIELPAEVRTLKLNGGLGVPIEHGDLWSWPEPFPGVRLDRLECPGGEGACVKGFSSALREGWAALANELSGDRLKLTWDATELPILGLWLNRGLCGFHHVALEPTHGAPDSLSDAITHWKSHAVILARGRVAWRLVYTLFPES
jgi:galactose mutarotase-like enzyme